MIDFQIGHEKSLTTILPTLAGANVIFGMGMMELGVTFSLLQLVIDDMLVGSIKNLLQMPKGLGGNYLSAGRLVEFLGYSNLLTEAEQKVRSILQYHRPEAVSSACLLKIRNIILEADRGEFFGEGVLDDKISRYNAV